MKKWIVVPLAVVLASCGGPVAPLDVGSKEVSLDLLLGERMKSVAQAPVPPLTLPVGPGGFPVLTPRRTEEPVFEEEDPGPCPEMDPLAVPKLVAMNTVSAPPKAATYKYRTTGRYQVGGANARDILLEPVSTWEVLAPVSEAGGGFTFGVKVTNGSASTTTTYRVLPLGANVSAPPVPGAPPTPPEAPAPNAGVPPGLYLASVSAEPKPFTPAFPGIAIVRFPIDLGTTFDASGSDGTTTMSWRSIVRPKETVDACGVPLDTYTVELTNGRLVQAGSQETLEFTSKIWLGTQFGGLAVAENTSVGGSQAVSNPVTRTLEMTTNQEPQAP